MMQRSGFTTGQRVRIITGRFSAQETRTAGTGRVAADQAGGVLVALDGRSALIWFNGTDRLVAIEPLLDGLGAERRRDAARYRAVGLMAYLGTDQAGKNSRP